MEDLNSNEALAILKLQATLFNELAAASELNTTLQARISEYELAAAKGSKTPTQEDLNGSGSQSNDQAKSEEVQGGSQRKPSSVSKKSD